MFRKYAVVLAEFVVDVPHIVGSRFVLLIVEGVSASIGTELFV